MLSQTASRTLSRRAHPATTALLSRSNHLASSNDLSLEAIGCSRFSVPLSSRLFTSQSPLNFAAPATVQRLELLNSSHDQAADFVRKALQEMLTSKDGALRASKAQLELAQRLKSFSVLLQEAKQCIEDCVDSAETDDFHEEAKAAWEAVEEVCSSYADIIDDLKGIEQTHEWYPFGVVKRSDFVRLSLGTQVHNLRNELATIMREWRAPLNSLPVE